MTDTPDDTIPAEAINAARNAVANKLFGIGVWAPEDADSIFADAALRAAAPLIAARAAAAQRQCDIQLAIRCNARYVAAEMPDYTTTGRVPVVYPFADLLAAQDTP